MEYSVWRACERFGLLPPNVQKSWDDCDVETQTLLLAYCEGRELEEIKQLEVMIGAGSKMI